jgi:hypothetical protein
MPLPRFAPFASKSGSAHDCHSSSSSNSEDDVQLLQLSGSLQWILVIVKGVNTLCQVSGKAISSVL